MMDEERKYYVYIGRCNDSTLYTGYTVNLKKRLDSHNSSNGAKYTRGRLPVSLIYYEKFGSASEALKREYQIKNMTRKQKLKMINSNKLNGGFTVEEIFSY